MSDRLLTLAAMVGATLVVTRSTLLARARRLYPPLFGCSQCAGFWVGTVAGAGGLVSVGRGVPVDALVAGCATSLLALLTDALLLKLLGDPEREKGT